ncbi:MMPL family transporter [Streptomyces shaanxiensis]
MATADQREQRERPDTGTDGPPTDLYAFAVRLRRMNGEINRLVQGFAGDHGLHATDIQALAAIMDADEPMTPSGLRRHLGLTSGAVTACVDRLERAGHIRRVRESADALVGGYTAQQYDTLRTAEHDRTLIVPVVLAIILFILVVLLRSLLLPVLLVATVALNFLTTLGVSALVLRHVLGFTGTDPSVPLYGFVFLVALGVDYNIFLMSRVREESLRHGVRQGTIRGLVTTGGVITSAGVVLAATFAALGVIPLAFLAQIAFIVAFGVLLDTLVVRSLLVPALVRDIGPGVWWPTTVHENPKT